MPLWSAMLGRWIPWNPSAQGCTVQGFYTVDLYTVNLYKLVSNLKGKEGKVGKLELRG